MAYRIGVLGGMGPLATHYFVDIFFKRFLAEFRPKNDQDYPDMTISMECSTPDRTISILNNRPEAGRRINRDIARLRENGCNTIVVPCITGHALIKPDWFRMGVIDIRQTVKNEFGGGSRPTVAILATDGSLESGVFAGLEDTFSLIYPKGDLQQAVMKIIYDSKGDNPSPSDCIRLIADVKKELAENGAEYFLAGCTEIEMFVGQNNICQNFILPMESLCLELMEKYRRHLEIGQVVKD